MLNALHYDAIKQHIPSISAPIQWRFSFVTIGPRFRLEHSPQPICKENVTRAGNLGAKTMHRLESTANDVRPGQNVHEVSPQSGIDPGQSPLHERNTSSGGTHVSPDAEAIFKLLDRLLDDEKAQIDRLHEPLRSQVLAGADCDEIAGAAGEFGRDTRNPIPVNGPLGAMIYLSNLRTESSQQVLFHRLGSIRNIDAYETVSRDGSMWDVLFLDLYHPRKSRRAPTGYKIASGSEHQSQFLGANEFVAAFPHQLPDAIPNTYERLLGGWMRPLKVRTAPQRTVFKRPSDHIERLDLLMALLHREAIAYRLSDFEPLSFLAQFACILCAGLVRRILPQGGRGGTSSAREPLPLH